MSGVQSLSRFREPGDYLAYAELVLRPRFLVEQFIRRPANSFRRPLIASALHFINKPLNSILFVYNFISLLLRH